MRQNANRRDGRRWRLLQRLQINKRLTPQECQALGLALGLFLLGLVVRWYRLAHLR